jgi:hypothetical protein
MKCDAYKGQTQCQRLPHEWSLGKRITKAKSYPRRNSVERRSVMPIWPTIQYKGIYFSYEYVVHAELFIDNLRHVGQQVLRADPTMYDFKTSCKFSTYYRFHIHFWQYMQYEFCDFASYLWWKPVFFFLEYAGELRTFVLWERNRPLTKITTSLRREGWEIYVKWKPVKVCFYDFRKRFAAPSVIWDKLFCNFRISMYTFHYCFYGTYAGKTNKSMHNEKYILVQI